MYINKAEIYRYFEQKHGMQRSDSYVATVKRCFSNGNGCILDIGIEGVEVYMPLSVPEGTKVLVSISALYRKKTFYGEIEDRITASLDSILVA